MSFKNIRKMMSSIRQLVYFNPNLDVITALEVWNSELGAISHISLDGSQMATAHASTTLLFPEKIAIK